MLIGGHCARDVTPVVRLGRLALAVMSGSVPSAELSSAGRCWWLAACRLRAAPDSAVCSAAGRELFMFLSLADRTGSEGILGVGMLFESGRADLA